MQAVHPHVVADVDHRRDLGADHPGMGPHADEEPGTANTAGDDHDPHEAILAHGTTELAAGYLLGHARPV